MIDCWRVGYKNHETRQHCKLTMSKSLVVTNCDPQMSQNFSRQPADVLISWHECPVDTPLGPCVTLSTWMSCWHSSLTLCPSVNMNVLLTLLSDLVSLCQHECPVDAPLWPCVTVNMNVLLIPLSDLASLCQHKQHLYLHFLLSLILWVLQPNK
jgi:hypothetical protein